MANRTKNREFISFLSLYVNKTWMCERAFSFIFFRIYFYFALTLVYLPAFKFYGSFSCQLNWSNAIMLHLFVFMCATFLFIAVSDANEKEKTRKKSFESHLKSIKPNVQANYCTYMPIMRSAGRHTQPYTAIIIVNDVI